MDDMHTQVRHLFPLPALLLAEVVTGLVNVTDLTVVEPPEVFMVPRTKYKLEVEHLFFSFLF